MIIKGGFHNMTNPVLKTDGNNRTDPMIKELDLHLTSFKDILRPIGELPDVAGQ